MTNTSKKPLKPKYNVELVMLDSTIKGQGITLESALNNLGITWQNIKLKGTLKIEYNGKKAEKVYYLPQLKKMFVSKEFKIVQIKYLHKLLK